MGAIRMALACPGVQVTTLEVDPVHMIIARNVILFAGMVDSIRVYTGHSQDLLPRLQAQRARNPSRFKAMFMDQRGSRYDEDIELMEQLGLLHSGAVIVADNVLKPGAPLFLWHM